jgi:hypothetical protein
VVVFVRATPREYAQYCRLGLGTSAGGSGSGVLSSGPVGASVIPR